MTTARKLIALFLTLSLLLTSVCALSEGGSWTVNTSVKSLMNDKQARQALKKATKTNVGYDLTPLALLGTQVVSGTNYCILCYGSTVTREPANSLCKAYVYEDLEGKAKLTKVREIKLKGAPSSGWKISRNKKALTVDKAARSALKKAIASLDGADYTLLLTLGKAKDAYSLLCRRRLTDRSGTTDLCIVALRKKGGKYTVRRIDELAVAE